MTSASETSGGFNWDDIFVPILAVIASMLIGMLLIAATGNDPLQAGLRKLTGKVTVNGQSAKAGMLIKPGDTVITGPGLAPSMVPST